MKQFYVFKIYYYQKLISMTRRFFKSFYGICGWILIVELNFGLRVLDQKFRVYILSDNPSRAKQFTTLWKSKKTYYQDNCKHSFPLFPSFLHQLRHWCNLCNANLRLRCGSKNLVALRTHNLNTSVCTLLDTSSNQCTISSSSCQPTFRATSDAPNH